MTRSWPGCSGRTTRCPARRPRRWPRTGAPRSSAGPRRPPSEPPSAVNLFRHLSYLGLLAGCLLGTAPLEFVLRTGVCARWRRLLAALLPGIVLGIGWDLYAIHRHQWSFDHRYLVGLS